MKIYLDDIRTPKSPEWLVARSFRDFTRLISEKFGAFEVPTVCDLEVTFDHDLAAEHYQFDYDLLRDDPNMTDCEESGYDAAKWLIAQNIIPKMFWVHSANPVGSQNILGLLNNWYRHNQTPQIGSRTFWETKSSDIIFPFSD